MHVRFLIMNAFGPGGTVRTTFDTAARLAQNHDVEIVSVLRHRERPVFVPPPKVQLRALVDVGAVGELPGHRRNRLLGSRRSRLSHPHDNRYASFSLATDLALAREIRATRDGVVIGTRPSINLALAGLARPQVHAVGQEHLHLRHWGRSLQADIAAAYPRLDAVTTLTRADRGAYRRALGTVPGLVLRALPNAVEDVHRPRTDHTAKVVVGAGRLTQQKGFDLLIRAFVRVHRDHPDWQLHIYGSGSHRGALAQLVDELALGDVVTLKGFTSRLPEAFASASVFAFSSRFEGFGLTLVEAMAAGLPLVTFACRQGPREIVEDGVSGILVPPRDVAEMGAQLSALLGDEPRRRALGAAALERAAHFSPAAVGTQWEDFLAALTARRPGRRRSRPRPRFY